MKSGIWTRLRCSGRGLLKTLPPVLFNRRGLLKTLPLVLLIAGCTKNSAAAGMEQRFAESAIPADVARMVPNTLVDQTGYGTGSEKLVIFRTDAPGDTFEVRSLDDDTVVYTGNILPASTGAEDVAYGPFSSFQTEGVYYIYTDASGASCSFQIGADITGDLCAGALRDFYLRRCGVAIKAVPGTTAREACHTRTAHSRSEPTLEIEVDGGWHTDAEGNRDVVSGCHALRDLLAAYETQKDRYGDDTGIPESGNGIPDILDEARTEIAWLNKLQTSSGSVYAGVTGDTDGETNSLLLADGTAEAEIAFAGAMARFGFLYDDFDKDYADMCVSCANAAWQAYTASRTPAQEPAAFAAAAELYRVTGEKKYESVLSGFFSRDDFVSLFRENDDVFYGSMTYLVTTQPVNVAVHDRITEALAEECARIVKTASESDYFAAQTDFDSGMRDMSRLAMANAVAYDHTYAGVIENYVHYLAGRNPEAVNYLSADTEYTYEDAGVPGALATPEQNAKFVLMTGGI